jgi:hypothetical protein
MAMTFSIQVDSLCLCEKIICMLSVIELTQCSTTGVPPQDFRCAVNFYNKLYIRTL